MIGCSSRICCSTRASVLKPVLPRRFLRQPELDEQDLPQLLGRADRELLAGQAVDVVLEVVQLAVDAVGDVAEALGVQAHALALHLAQHRHQRQLDVAHQRRQPAVAQLLALPGGERADRRRLGGQRVLGVGAQAALLDQLAQRVAAALGLEQVGGQQRVVDEVGRHDVQRLGVVGDERLARQRVDHFGAAGGRAGDRVAVGGDGEAQRRGRQQLALRRSPARPRRPPARRPAGGVGQRALADLHADRDVGGGRGGGLVGIAQRVLQPAQRIAQLELAKDLAQPGAVGLAGQRRGDVEVGAGHVALGGGQLLGDARQLGVLAQVLLALGPRDVVDVLEHALQRPPRLQQLRGGLVADPGNAGDVVGRVALEPVEVGDQLGADAVAVDHLLGPVELGLGDPPRGGHDLDVLVDELEGVAIAGDDRHLDAVGLGPLGERGDHVVGLEALDAIVGVAERVDQRLHVRVLLAQQIRARRPVALVLAVDLAPAAGAPVPYDHRRLDAVVGDQLHEHRRKAEDRVGGEARRSGDRLGQREERPVHQRVAVDQEELARGAVAGHACTVSRTGRST